MFRQAQIHPQAEKGKQLHQSNPRGVIKQPSMIQTHSSKNISGVLPAPSRDVTLFEAPQTSNIPTTICEETPGSENRIGNYSIYHTAILLQPKRLGFKPFRVLKACPFPSRNKLPRTRTGKWCARFASHSSIRDDAARGFCYTTYILFSCGWCSFSLRKIRLDATLGKKDVYAKQRRWFLAESPRFVAFPLRND